MLLFFDFSHSLTRTASHFGGLCSEPWLNARIEIVAAHFAHAGEVAHGHLQLDRDRGSYLSPNYDPLVESGQMTLLDVDNESVQVGSEICPGISVELFPGHTDQLMGVHIESRSLGGAVEHACYISDLIPTSSHLEPTWVMGYDLDPVETIAQRIPRDRSIPNLEQKLVSTP